MSDCGVCLSGAEDFCDVWEVDEVRAAKPHKCCECSREIPKGAKYVRVKMLYEGSWESTHTCLVCSEIRQTFYCEGEVCGQLWADMGDYAFPKMTTGCLDRLKTAEAKAYLVERWQAWKGLRN